MKSKIILIGSIIGLFAAGVTSCSEFLDVLPDNRAEVNAENVVALAVSAYPTSSFYVIAELSSDNADEYPKKYLADRIAEDIYNWIPTSEKQTDSPHQLWNSHYKAISSANQVLETIEKEGNLASLNGVKGEALLCRAYGHFVLANIFCQAYGKNAGTDLGISYMKSMEKTVNPKYSRGTLEETYQNIEKDLLEGIELIGEATYAVPAYHFTARAAYAFAARFYLYYTKEDRSNCDKVIDYATKALGVNPAGIMRNWATLGPMDMDKDQLPNAFVDDKSSANFLLGCTNSRFMRFYGASLNNTRFAHGPQVALETCDSNGPWGGSDMFHMRTWSNPGSLPTKVFQKKFNEYFQILDKAAGTGYPHIVQVVFTAEETLLCRAEAYILKGSAFYAQAIEDLNTWQTAYTNGSPPLTEDVIDAYYGSRMKYYTPEQPTVKKALNPEIPFVDAKQENMMHCLLHIRRITTLHEGLRWQDIKRYRIVIYRRYINEEGLVSAIKDSLRIDDPRRAIQIPADALSGGMEPNLR